MRVYNLLKVIFSFLGAALLVGSVVSYQNTTGFVSSVVETQGVVTDLIYSRSSDFSAYYPIVEFADASSRTIEFQSSSGSNPAPRSLKVSELTVFLAMGRFFDCWNLGGAG